MPRIAAPDLAEDRSGEGGRDRQMPAPRALKGREGRSRPDLRGSQRHQRAPNTAWISTNVMAYPRAAAEALPSTDSISVTTSNGRVPSRRGACAGKRHSDEDGGSPWAGRGDADVIDFAERAMALAKRAHRCRERAPRPGAWRLSDDRSCKEARRYTRGARRKNLPDQRSSSSGTERFSRRYPGRVTSARW